MSGFNTKERNNNGEFEITFYTENRQDFKKVQDLCRELIGHGTPISNGGDLISREALKKAIDTIKQIGYDTENKPLFDYVELPDLIKVIDNAPTVAVNCKDCDGYEAGYSAGLKDAERSQDKCGKCPYRNTEKCDVCINRIRNMRSESEKPQGEWIDYDNTFYKCPDCGYLLEKCCPQCQNKVILPKGGAK